MPVGSLPPYVVRLDAGSLPVGYLVFESKTRSIGQLQDLALFRVRTMFAGLAGISSPPPFGGNIRTIVVNVDPDRLRSYNLSPQDVVAAIDRGNFISPSGNVTIKDQLTVVPNNAMVVDPQEIRNIPLKLGENVYIRDVGSISDATDIPVGYALVNGNKSVYLPVVKQASASTLSVVNAVKQNMSRFQAALPDDVTISYQFDESPIVYRAIESVGVEGALGAGLTGLMVLLFLRDLRAVIVVVLNIPLALLGSIVVLNLTGHSINIMTLGGLALAIGILVDEATVEIENIHTQMEHTPSMSRAVRQGNTETAVPRLLALLCILSVFIPSFIMAGAGAFVVRAALAGRGRVDDHVVSALEHVGTGPERLAAGEPARDARSRQQRQTGAAGVLRAVPGSITSGSCSGRWRIASRWSWCTWSSPVPSWSAWEGGWVANCSRGWTPASSSSAFALRRARTTS